MRYLTLLIVLLSFAFTTVQAQKVLPDVKVSTMTGQKKSIKDFVKKDKITIISFWATWCKPCKLELDNLAELYPQWQDDYDVEIIAITIDTERALRRVKPLVKTKGWEYTILSDKNRDLHKALGFQDVPATVVLDKNKNVIYTHSGYKLGDEEALEDHIKEISGK